MSTELATQPKTIREFISGDAFKNQVALALPSHIKPDRFVRVALTTLTRTPKLADCSRETLLRCLMDCSQLGLEPDGRHAHLIPYGKDCQLIIDWKGLVALARRSGEVAVWRAELVCENDTFSWANSIVQHAIDWRKPRGAMQAVYSYVKFNDGNEDYEVMTMDEVKAIQKRSKAGTSGPWVTDFNEMAKKTVLRRHSKRLTLSPEFHEALERDYDRLPERNVTPAPVPSISLAAIPAAPEEKPAKKPRQTQVPESALDDFWKAIPADYNDEQVRGALVAIGAMNEGDEITPEVAAAADMEKLLKALSLL
ncbi:MAG: hypothetical protein E6Q97_23860 [Desulfurellales bacterium]|nr:MAG: hypothetical protein E6Q97_23860 [Desulfurellales bacterium]